MERRKIGSIYKKVRVGTQISILFDFNERKIYIRNPCFDDIKITERWSSCKEAEEGDLISWSSLEFLNTIDDIENSDPNFCTNHKIYFVFKHLKTFPETEEWCQIIGGEIANPSTTDDISRIVSSFLNKVDACPDGFFIRNWNNVVDQSFLNQSNANPKKCVHYNIESGVLKPFYCSEKLCPVCQLEKFQKFEAELVTGSISKSLNIPQYPIQ